MNYCENCGIKLDEGEKFCHACGTQLVETPVVQKSNKKYISPEDNKKGNTLGILSLLLMFGPPVVLSIIFKLFEIDKIDFISNLILLLLGGCFIGSIVSLIIARIKYPNNLLSKVVMWMYIISVVTGIVSLIILAAACQYFCSGIT